MYYTYSITDLMCLLVSLRKARNVKSIWIQSCVTDFLFHDSILYMLFLHMFVKCFCLHAHTIKGKQNELFVTSIIYKSILVVVKNMVTLHFTPYSRLQIDEITPTD